MVTLHVVGLLSLISGTQLGEVVPTCRLLYILSQEEGKHEKLSIFLYVKAKKKKIISRDLEINAAILMVLRGFTKA